MNTANLGKFIIICGHYGCGKTNFALNVAAERAGAGEKVTLVDMDIVNPYFRSSDYPEFLAERGIELIAPNFAHSNVDLPSLPARMYSVFESSDTVIIDVGGDDDGSTALGRFNRQLMNIDYQMLYVVNRYRDMSNDPEVSAQLLREIEYTSRLKATAVVSNAHLCGETEAEHIICGAEYAEKTAKILGLPMIMTTCEKKFAFEVSKKIDNVYPIDIIVTKPWETEES